MDNESSFDLALWQGGETIDEGACSLSYPPGLMGWRPKGLRDEAETWHHVTGL